MPQGPHPSCSGAHVICKPGMPTSPHTNGLSHLPEVTCCQAATEGFRPRPFLLSLEARPSKRVVVGWARAEPQSVGSQSQIPRSSDSNDSGPLEHVLCGTLLSTLLSASWPSALPHRTLIEPVLQTGKPRLSVEGELAGGHPKQVAGLGWRPGVVAERPKHVYRCPCCRRPSCSPRS